MRQDRRGFTKTEEHVSIGPFYDQCYNNPVWYLGLGKTLLTIKGDNIYVAVRLADIGAIFVISCFVWTYEVK